MKVQALDERTYTEMTALQALSGRAGLPDALAACVLGHQAMMIVMPDAGETMKECLPVPVHTALAWGAEICDKLTAMHRAGWLHLDVHPENVCVPSSGIHLIDAGAAQRLQARDDGSYTYVGTPRGGKRAFAPLEQLDDCDIVTLSAATDVFATAGVVCWLLAGGETPFGPKTGPVERWHSLCHPRRQAATLSAWVHRICKRAPTDVVPALLKALNEEPSNRGSVSELQCKLAAVAVAAAAAAASTANT